MKAKTAIIKYQPYTTRDENCALGILAFLESGEIKLHLVSDLKKAVALNPNESVSALRDNINLTVDYLNENKGAWEAYKSGFGHLRFSAGEGYFHYENDEEYDRAVKWHLDMSATPATPDKRAKHKTPATRLFSELKRSFESYGWMGKSLQDIDKHKLVTHYPISSDEDISAEFALKNGVLRLVETIDFRVGETSAKRHEARGKALVFDIAKDINKKTNCTVVVGGTDLAESKSTLKMLNRYADKVISFESTADMRSLFKDIGVATGRPMLEMPVAH
jgi:hypothetical protein